MDIRISRSLHERLMTAAREAMPAECCGLLLGAGDTVEAIAPAANVSASPLVRFEIDPAVLIAAERRARNGGPQVLGYYHSHPDGSLLPSAEDAARAACDGRLWMIIANGRASLWRNAPGGAHRDVFEPLALVVLDQD
ncbi:MAG: M67 family metallopeptidase [Blastomonas sp.]